MKTFLEEVWYWLRVIGLWLLVAMFIWRWLRTRHFGKGHEVLGMIAVFFSGSLWLVLATAEKFTPLFNPLFTFTVAIWIGYDNWYFFDSESYVPIIRESREKFGLFWNNTSIARWLMSDSRAPATNPFTWKMGAIVGAALLPIALLFGFSRVVRYIAMMEQVKVEAYQKGKAETKQAVLTAVSSVTNAVVSSTNSVTASQQRTLEKVDGNLFLIQSVAKEQKEVRADLKKRQRPVKTPSRPLIIFVPQARQYQSGPPLPMTQTVKPLQPNYTPAKNNKRGRKTSYENPSPTENSDEFWYRVARYGELVMPDTIPPMRVSREPQDEK